MLPAVLLGPKAVPIMVTVLGCTAVAVSRRRRRIHGMTPERQQIYEAALLSLKDSDRLRKLADAFATEGLIDQSLLLRQRADLSSAPVEKKLERREIYRRALRSKNPKSVLDMAAAFDKLGATGAAYNLRQYAAALIKLGAAADQPLPAPASHSPALPADHGLDGSDGFEPQTESDLEQQSQNGEG